jgi:hypothetical protein
MDARLTKFEQYKDHAWLSKAYGKLKADERATAVAFILVNSELDKGAFELKVNRMFVDKPKPKNWTILLELLTCCNS